jgi:tRNA (guanine37-N1)-methyltransferase
MKFNILTLFPDAIVNYLNSSILKIAQEKKATEYELHDFREYADNKHKKVDDTPYGGGAGMVLQAQPIYDCIEAIKQKDPDTHVIFPSPRGKTLNQTKLQELAAKSSITLICGRYEGLDQRAIDLCVDEEISLGDFILCGGELPSLCIVEGITRLLPEVLGNQESHQNESFGKNLDGKKKHPIYTKPEEFQGLKVPEVLLSGHHANIETWQKENLND